MFHMRIASGAQRGSPLQSQDMSYLFTEVKSTIQDQGLCTLPSK